jgi:photosystem II stability/assembly factor-like uncharacterized protein
MKSLNLILCLTALLLTSCDKSNPINSVMGTSAPPRFQLINAGVKDNLHSVVFVNSQVGYIAGDSGLILRTGDGGNSWTVNAPTTRFNYNCVTFSPNGTGYVFGDTLTMINTTDGGSNWRVLIAGMTFVASNLKTGYCTDQYFETAGNEFTWKGQNGGGSIRGVKMTDANYKSMKRVSDSISIVVGDNGLIRRRNTLNFDNSWYTVASPASNNLNGLAFINDSIGFIIGSNGTIMRTENAGISWQLMTSISAEKLNDIYFINPAAGIIIGDNGQRFITADSGKSWANFSTPVNKNLNSVSSIDGQKLIIVGDEGTILKER